MAALPLELVDADPGQPRREFDPDALERLAGSLVRHGQLQPITVRRGPAPGRYTIVCGERRWRAAALAWLGTIDAVVLDGGSEGPLDFERQLVENSLREALAPLDQARAFQALMAYHGWSARRLAKALHVSHTTVHRALALLALPEPLRADVEAGRLAPRTARAAAGANPPSAFAASSRAAASWGAVVADDPAGDDERPVPAMRRVFPTKGGRVIVEIDHPGDRVSILEAVIETCDVLKAEARFAPAPSPVKSLSEFMQKTRSS